MIGEKIQAFWTTQQGLSSYAPCVVGLSGGIDSVVMAYALIHGNFFDRNQIILAYINHGWRQEAANEEKFIEALADVWGTTCIIGRVTDPIYKSEGAARQARYQLLGEIAEAHDAKGVFVAHHADDQAETLLLHLLRGSGLAGLAGMQAISPFPIEQFRHLKLIRPLLNAKKAEIQQYAEAHQLPFVQDQSNNDLSYQRNHVRQQLLPLLKKYNPSLVKTLTQTADILAADYQALHDITTQHWPNICHTVTTTFVRFDVETFKAQAISIQRLLLRQICTHLSGSTANLSFKEIEQARDVLTKQQTGQIATLGQSIQIHIFYDDAVASIGKPTAQAFTVPQLPSSEVIPLPIPGRAELQEGWFITAQAANPADLVWDDIRHNDNIALVQLDENDTLQIRSRRSGERFHSFGAKGSKKLKDWMIDRKIPAILRLYWPLICIRQSDTPIWVVQQEISQQVAMTTEQARLVLLKLHQPNK